MAQDLVMPKLGLTMSEGTLLEWKVEPGQSVRKGQVLYVIETDKTATEIEAETDGLFEARIVSEGETVPVGAPVGRMSGGSGAKGVSLPSATEPAVAVAKKAGEAPSEAIDAPVAVASTPSTQATGEIRIIATPLARRIARQRGIDLRTVTGSGPRGRIKAADVAHMSRETEPATPVAGAARSESAVRQKPSPVRASMARRLAEVKHGVPHFYLSTEVEVSRLMALRNELNADQSLPRLTLTHFVLAAVGRALCDLPNINRVWDAGELVAYAASDVGLAVETGNGLFVPILRNAGTTSLDRIATSARDLIEKARSGRLGSNDMTGATISVSNAGMYDVTWLTSIINPGQSAILGVGSVRQVFRPDEAGAPALHNEMGIVFSGDHRVHTGVEGLTFIKQVKTYLEAPMGLLRHRQKPES